MSVPLPYPLDCARGQTWVQPFAAADPTTGSPEAVNVTGWTIRFTLRGLLDPTPLVVLDTLSGGVSITDATNGLFAVTLTAAQTAALPDRCWYSADRADAGAEEPLQRGPLAVRGSGL